MKRIFRILFLTLHFALIGLAAQAQSSDRDYIRIGNKHFRNAIVGDKIDASEYNKALTNFSKALEKKKTVEAYYNYGCASLALSQDSTANVSFLDADSLGFTNPLKRAKNFHNLGNIWYSHGAQQMRSGGEGAGKAFQTAVEFYKASLRCNPKDDETRYNLAKAQHMLKKSQNQNGGGGGGGNDDKNKEKQKQQQQQQQQQQEQKDQMSDQAAEQLLNSAQQDEKNVQQKVKGAPQRRRSLEKDW